MCVHRQVWRATSVEERQGKNKPKQGGPLEFMLRLPETGSVEIGAGIPAAFKSILGRARGRSRSRSRGRGKKSELGQTFSFYAEKDGAAWLEAVRAQVGVAKFLGSEMGAPVDNTAGTSTTYNAEPFRSPAARSFVTPVGPPLKEGWVELIDFSSFSDAERHALREADLSFTNRYLVLWPGLELAFFEGEDTSLPPLGARSLSSQEGQRRVARGRALQLRARLLGTGEWHGAGGCRQVQRDVVDLRRLAYGVQRLGCSPQRG